MIRLVFLLVTAGLLAHVLGASRQCFTGDGTPASGVIPCQPSADTSACCAAGQMCFAGGTCMTINETGNPLTLFWAGSCTDTSATTSSACAALAECKYRGFSGGGLSVCNGQANTYCCYGLDSCNCLNASQIFTLPPLSAITILPSSTGTSTSKTTTATQSTGLTSVTPTTTPTSDSSSSSNSLALGVGVGLGVGLGIPIIFTICFCIWWSSRKRKAAAAEEARAQHAPIGTQNYGSPPPAWASPLQSHYYDPVPKTEAPSDRDPVQIDSHHLTAELPGGHQARSPK